MNAQDFPHEFGKYSGDEMLMKKYDKDPTAEAVVIYDIGESFFEEAGEGLQIVFQRRTKIKILNKAGLKWAQFEIPYYEGDHEVEKVYDLKGNTYNFENGAIRTKAFDKRNVYEEKKDEHWLHKKFAMPDVKEGSVIEVSYCISSPYVFNFRSWEFQYTIPVIYSEYKTKMVPFYDYAFILQGAEKFDSNQNYEEQGFPHQYGPATYHNMVYEFIMRNVPAFKDEGFITSANDYIMRLDFQLSGIHRLNGSNEKIMRTWPEVVKELLDGESFGKYLKACTKNGKAITDTMKLGLPLEKQVEIFDRYVKDNFNWNGRQHKFASKSVKDFLKTKTGSSAEINLYLTGLLKAAGIEVYPVIISTRDNGKVKVGYPFLHYFDYVIVAAKVNNKYVLLDATEPLCQYGEMPIRCLNDVGLVINNDKTEWVNFKGTDPSLVCDSVDLQLNSNADMAMARFDIKTTGYDALTLRKIWARKANVQLKEELFITNLTLKDSIKAFNLFQIDKPFKISFEAEVSTEKVEDKVLVYPFCGTAIFENPFKQLARTYPIDMVYKKKRQFATTLHLPDGYKVLSKPENLSVKNNLLEVLYNIETVDFKTLKITSSYEFKKEVYESSEYSYLKMIYNKIIDRFNDKIVLVKN